MWEVFMFVVRIISPEWTRYLNGHRLVQLDDAYRFDTDEQANEVAKVWQEKFKVEVVWLT